MKIFCFSFFLCNNLSIDLGVDKSLNNDATPAVSNEAQMNTPTITGNGTIKEVKKESRY